MSNTANLLTSTLASSLRGWQGIRSRTDVAKPAKLLELYDIENCPYCRIVREVLTELDLDAVIYPCPKGGERYRGALVRRGGKALFPYLVDPNSGVEMYESLDIIRYLYEQYGGGSVPLRWQLGFAQKLSSQLASASRITRGMYALPSKKPARSPVRYASCSARWKSPMCCAAAAARKPGNGCRRHCGSG